jgi:hypothetical protein
LVTGTIVENSSNIKDKIKELVEGIRSVKDWNIIN